MAVGAACIGCSSTLNHWEDITGRGRGSADFTMDRGRCDLVSQNASNQTQALVDEENANGRSSGPGLCATLAVGQVANVIMSGKNAFNSCMNAMGWSLVADNAWSPDEEPTDCKPSATECVSIAPPPPKRELTGNPPRPGDIWFPGYYRYYEKTGYQWEEGRWHEPNPGHTWIPPYWSQTPTKKWMRHAGRWL